MDDQAELIIAVELEECVSVATWGDDDPRPVTVDVVINDDTGQGVFTMESDAAAGGIPIVQNYVLEFDNYQNGVYSNGFVVGIRLPADKGRNADWTFDADPIWAKLLDKHGACPGNKNQNDPSILTNPPPSLSADKRTLTFGNANSAEQYFGFALRFAHVNKGRKLTYDPIGNNQNGSSRA
jgi:hypothetical protein